MDNNYFVDERYNKMHVFICIIAAASVVIICLILQETLFRMAFWASVAIATFYVVGNLVRYYLVTYILPPPPETVLEEDEFMMDEMGEEEMENTETMADAPANPESTRPKAADYMSRE